MYDDLNSEARTLIEQSRAGESPPAGSRDRVRHAIMAKVGAAAFVAAAPAHAIGLSLSASAKVVLVAMTVAAGSGLGLYRMARTENAKARVEDIRPAVAATPTAEPGVVPRPLVPLQSKPVPRKAPSRRASPTADTNSLLKETAALAAAQTQLRDGAPAAALALLKAYDIQHPAGILREESEATRIQALLDLGERERACNLSRGFSARWPRSPHLLRVRSACEKP